MPPVLDPSKSKVDGLAFLGLSLAQNSSVGHPASETHQSNFDLNEVIDRDYQFLFSTNDDGWLVGGGEPGPPTSYKLAAKDSAHVEVMRIGTYCKEWGGLPQEEIIEAIKAGEILIPQIEVLPTGVVANPDNPPELEIRFDMEPPTPNFEDMSAPLPVNWQLRFLHNQLFKRFIFPSRFCPGAFHSTILRKAEFRSEEHRTQYFAKCDAAIKVWRERGVMPLNEVKRDISGNPFITKEKKSRPEPTKPESPCSKKSEEEKKDEESFKLAKSYDSESNESQEACHSGIWLFTDRENISHFFEPNFLPPYDTPEKRMIILHMLKEEWVEETLSWKNVDGSDKLKKLDETQGPNAASEATTDHSIAHEEEVTQEEVQAGESAPEVGQEPSSTSSGVAKESKNHVEEASSTEETAPIVTGTEQESTLSKDRAIDLTNVTTNSLEQTPGQEPAEDDETTKVQESDLKLDETLTDEVKEEAATMPTVSGINEAEEEAQIENGALDSKADEHTKSKGVKISVQIPESKEEKNHPLIDTLDTFVGDVISKAQVACCSPFGAQKDPSMFIDEVNEIGAKN